MIKKSVFSVLFLVFATWSPYALAQECIKDYHQVQNLVPHSLTQDQLDTLKEFADAGNPAEGWAYLGEFGDAYASVSAKVVSQDPQYKNENFHKLVRKHWKHTVGKKKTAEFFQAVAVQHFRDYVEIMRTGFWPDSDQILLSYLTAARAQGLPDRVVFDEAWEKSGLNYIVSWEGLLGIKSARIVEHSNVCSSVKSLPAFFDVMYDMISLPF